MNLRTLFFLIFLLLSLSVLQAQVTRSGPLPDAHGYTPEGEPVKLRELTKGHYTVLAAGCLTCPEFHRGYTEVELAHADYANKGVRFFYIYKSLRHPELNGYIEPQNLEERLLHLAVAREKLGTKPPWIADSMDDSIRIGLGAGANSIYIISPEGEILHGAERLRSLDLRATLAKLVGDVEQPTTLADLDLPTIERQRRANKGPSINRVVRPDGLTILNSIPASIETYYVKVRAEAEPELLKTGKGRLFLGFYPDPILEAHWNNLTTPMRYTLTIPDGVTATPQEASADKGAGDSDVEPRQFWVEVNSAEPFESFELKYHYFACTEELCQALTHSYTIQMVAEDNGARTFGFNRGSGGKGGKKGKGGKGGKNRTAE